jgi:RNA polymerase sigma-70 factor (ECF subfamily)
LADADEILSGLIARVALRDRAAFSRLYSLAAPKLFAICLRLLRDRPLAEDALQEVFVKIWRNAASFSRRGAPPRAWLAAIARNHAIDLLRARPPRTAALEDVHDLGDPSPDPERSAMGADEARRIERCMETLPEGRAAAIRAAYVEGYSYEELSRDHGVPLNTMRTWLRRGLIALRRCLEGGEAA